MQMRGLRLDCARPEIPEDPADGLRATSRKIIGVRLALMPQIDARITALAHRSDAAFRSSQNGRRTARPHGTGPEMAIAVGAAVGDGRECRPAASRPRDEGGSRATRERRQGAAHGIGKRGDRHL